MRAICITIFFGFITLFTSGRNPDSVNLEGLLKAIDYSNDDEKLIRSLSISDTEWLLFNANVENAFDYSGPRIIMLIGEGIKKNQEMIPDDLLEDYMHRTVEIAKLSENRNFFSSTVKVLQKKFNHQIINDYLSNFQSSDFEGIQNSPIVIERVGKVDVFGQKTSDLPLVEGRGDALFPITRFKVLLFAVAVLSLIVAYSILRRRNLSK